MMLILLNRGLAFRGAKVARMRVRAVTSAHGGLSDAGRHRVMLAFVGVALRMGGALAPGRAVLSVVATSLRVARAPASVFVTSIVTVGAAALVVVPKAAVMPVPRVVGRPRAIPVAMSLVDLGRAHAGDGISNIDARARTGVGL